MVFADYDYYVNEYGGKLAGQDEFERYIQFASAYIQMITFGRAKNCGLDAVKDAACAACEVFVKRNAGNGIRSENTDGYSVTYEECDPAVLKGELKGVVRGYLEHTGLLNRV